MRKSRLIGFRPLFFFGRKIPLKVEGQASPNLEYCKLYTHVRRLSIRKQGRMGGMKESQISLLVSLGLVCCARACTFAEREGQVLVALDALTFPIQGEDAKTQCASTASAFGMLGAAVSAFTHAAALPVLCSACVA